MFDLDMSLNPTFLFIDGSYYCYHRFYSLMRWWKTTHSEVSLDEPFQNTEFVEKFQKTFIANIKNISKKLNIHKYNPIIVVGKDCKRENIWRNELLPTYKANRENPQFKGGPFFKLAYENDYFQQGGAKVVLKHPKLEGDDCIAITVKYLLQKHPKCNIYIITSDRDYLQLVRNNVNIYDLSFKPLRTDGNPENDLEIKIIMGDKSDNIPPVFLKCGEKTAKKCMENADLFQEKITNIHEHNMNYELNTKLIDFDYIPQELVLEFIQTILIKKE